MGERRLGGLHIAEVRLRHRAGQQPSAVRGDDDGDAIGLVDAEAAQEHRIDDRIHGCRDRDADRERENREGCEERRRAEPPEREPDVATHGCRG